MRSLRGYLAAMLAMMIGPLIIFLFVFQQSSYANWTNTLPVGLQILMGPRFGIAFRLLTTALLALTLIGSGLSRRELYLTKSDLKAPVKRNLLFRWSMPWWLQAVVFLLIFSGGIATFLVAGAQLGSGSLSAVLVAIPFILLAAAINAFVEEFIHRSVLIARLKPVLGGTHANWLQASFFGLGHFYGIPTGPGRVNGLAHGQERD